LNLHSFCLKINSLFSAYIKTINNKEDNHNELQDHQ
jgi:hypothetical protein